MPYTPNPIHFRTDISSHGVVLERDGALFTGAVDSFLISYWQYGFGNVGFFEVSDNTSGAGPVNILQFRPSHKSGGGNLVVGMSTPAANMLDATYTSLPDAACPCHWLISVRLSTSTIQFYLNDAPITGSVAWTSPAPVTFTGSTTVTSWGDTVSPYLYNNEGYGSDFWFNPGIFVDLTVVANRRKFINADLTPVDLGANGQLPFGTSPLLFQNVLTGGVANDWLTNRGTAGGTFILDQSTITLDGNPCGTGPPPSETLTDAELAFGPTGGFVDFTNASNRRLFVSPNTTPQWLGPNGALGFGGTIPPVYLTTLGPPTNFAQNNGTGGSFAVTQPISAAGGPGCTDYYITEAAGPAANPEWRLTVSDDGGRTWSTLVKPRSIGALGQYLTRLRWLKMGQSRQRMIRLECSDPVRRNVVGFYIDVTAGMG